MNKTHLLYSAKYALVAAVLMVAFGMLSFFSFEPSVSRAITSQFTVTQQITNEISFVATTSATTMVGTIAGLTGGFATGTNITVVNTNNSTGYTMTLAFPTTTSGKAMQASSTAFINDYLPAGGTPTSTDYTWIDHTSGQSAMFGFTVRASTSNEVSSYFKNNGSACNTGASESDNNCWARPSTSAMTLINSTGPNTSSTSTIKFKVMVPNNPSPSLPSGFYVATATLTATTNP